MDIRELKDCTSGLVVLYVEDDPVARVQLQDVLNMLFKEVLIAIDGQEGLDIYKEHSAKVDLILTDIEMPKMNGLKMSEEIKKREPSQYILILSAHGDSPHFTKAIDIGVDGFILKPIAMDKLFVQLSKACSVIKKNHLEEEYHREVEKRLFLRSKELEKSMITDELTGVYNKTKLTLDISALKEVTAVLFNIDNFDHINSTYGYDIGDIALRGFANILDSARPLEATLYRLASDEFVYLFEELDLDSVGVFVEKVRDKLSSESIHADGIEFHLSATAGIAKGHGREVLANAHVAMKEIREHGKNRYHFYTPRSTLQTKQKNNIEWIKKVKQALKEDRLIPFFQPIINNKTGHIEKYECLARIVEEGRVVSPAYFIEPAKLSGLLPQVTKTMLEKSFDTFSRRNEEFSVNITECDLREGYLPSMLSNLLARYDIEPNRVVLEILENISAQGSKEALEQLKEIKKMGIKLAMDDFGSEKSNFYRLQELNVNYIKIDGSFIKGIAENENSYQISKTITQMAKALNAKVIAEFVATKEIHGIVNELGIDYSQGYYFGEPKELGV